MSGISAERDGQEHSTFKCRQCRWDIPDSAEVIQSIDGARFDTWECLGVYEEEQEDTLETYRATHCVDCEQLNENCTCEEAV